VGGLANGLILIVKPPLPLPFVSRMDLLVRFFLERLFFTWMDGIVLSSFCCVRFVFFNVGLFLLLMFLGWCFGWLAGYMYVCMFVMDV